MGFTAAAVGGGALLATSCGGAVAYELAQPFGDGGSTDATAASDGGRPGHDAAAPEAGSGASSGSGWGSSGSGSGGSGSGSGASSGSSSGGSGGSNSGACTFGPSYDGTASFTWYYFGQGTHQQDGYYETACGYQGSEAGNAGQNSVDMVLNVATASPASNRYFAAVPSTSSSSFDAVNDCGACAEITNGGAKIVATVIDACPKDTNPPCQSAGHLDLSTSAFNALGYPVGDPTGTTWRFVACPVSGNVQARLKSGNVDQVYLENTVFPIVAVSANGQPANHLSYGAWQLANGAPAGGATLTMTDVQGHAVTASVPGGGGDMGVQFPSPSPCD
jgi:hypothetical protein